MHYVQLNQGNKIPQLGLGVYQTADGQQTMDAVCWALEAGYRHIDTAKIYGNEKSVGDAIRESKIPRQQIFLPQSCGMMIYGPDGQRKHLMKAWPPFRQITSTFT